MALKGDQPILDKNKNGKLDKEDFKIMGEGGNSPEMKYKQGGNSPEQFGIIKSARNVLSADYGDLKGMDKFKLGAKNYFGGLVGLDPMNAPGTEDTASTDPNMAGQIDTLRNQMNKMGYNQNVMMMQNQGAGAAFAKKGKVYGQESAGEAGGSALAKKGCTRKRY